MLPLCSLWLIFLLCFVCFLWSIFRSQPLGWSVWGCSLLLYPSGFFRFWILFVHVLYIHDNEVNGSINHSLKSLILIQLCRRSGASPERKELHLGCSLCLQMFWVSADAVLVDDILIWLSNRRQSVYFQPLQLPPGEWPWQVIFDPRSHQEHVAYIVKSRRGYFGGGFELEGGLYRYNVQDRTILQQLPCVNCIKCLRDGQLLLAMRAENMKSYHDPGDWIHSVVVLDSASFIPLLKVKFKPDVGLQDVMFFHSRKTILCSADFKTISFFTWKPAWLYRNRSEGVLTLTLVKPCLPFMTLKESCRVVILQHARVQDVTFLPLPESLKYFLRGV